jgi:pyruvate dehydrogenase E2 component (dihydrolipoamide acetyltransferase)
MNQSLTGKVHITINDMIVKAVAQAMKKFPNLNSTFEDDHLILHPDVNVGIVLAIEPGIIVPAIMQAQNKSLTQISQTAKDLVKRAQEGALKPEEYGGATFSISNLGMFDVDEFIAIIMPPNSAMLGVGSVKPQPTVRDGQICVTQVMKVTLSVDHRVTDGVEAARFLTEFRKLLEEPLGLLI